VGGGLQPGAALVVICLAVVTLPPRSTAPTVAGCRLVGCSVVSGRPLRSRDVVGVSLHVCVCLGPVLASHATSLPAAAAAAWRGWGRVHIAGWSYGGVGPVRGLHIISVRPSKQPLMVRTFLKVLMELGSYFLFLPEQIKDIIIFSETPPSESSFHFRPPRGGRCRLNRPVSPWSDTTFLFLKEQIKDIIITLQPPGPLDQARPEELADEGWGSDDDWDNRGLETCSSSPPAMYTPPRRLERRRNEGRLKVKCEDATTNNAEDSFNEGKRRLTASGVLQWHGISSPQMGMSGSLLSSGLAQAVASRRVNCDLRDNVKGTSTVSSGTRACINPLLTDDVVYWYLIQ
jgi:hypothetical protein